MKKTILAIETSCDETSIALIRAERTSADDITVETAAHVVHSQIDIHAQYGGVFPALAKREHTKNLVPILLETFKKSREVGADFLTQRDTRTDTNTLADIEQILEREPELYQHIVRHLDDLSVSGIDMIAVTQGPGLEPALWVGINFARALGVLWDIPVMPANHMEGHIVSALFDTEQSTIQDPAFPLLTLLISGGHTELVLTDKNFTHRTIGKTRDDAAGEAFDKVARLLGLPYPGGPEISKLAHEARKSDTENPYTLPRPMKDADNLDFSFSGLKTAVLYLTKELDDMDRETKQHIAEAFEDAVADVLAHKLGKALEETGAQSVAVGGGVAANRYIREKLQESVHAYNSHMKLLTPASTLNTDNALMIALATAHRELHPDHADQKSVPDHAEIRAQGNMTLS